MYIKRGSKGDGAFYTIRNNNVEKIGGALDGLSFTRTTEYSLTVTNTQSSGLALFVVYLRY